VAKGWLFLTVFIFRADGSMHMMLRNRHDPRHPQTHPKPPTPPRHTTHAPARASPGGPPLGPHGADQGPQPRPPVRYDARGGVCDVCHLQGPQRGAEHPQCVLRAEVWVWGGVGLGLGGWGGSAVCASGGWGLGRCERGSGWF